MRRHIAFGAVLVGVAGLLWAATSFRSTAEAQPPATVAGKTAVEWRKVAVVRRVERDHARSVAGEMTREVRRLTRQLAIRGESVPIVAIRLVFGPYAWQAIRVSSCETGGTFDINAQNGQYLGLFQMGSYARGKYGHAHSALAQAQAAYQYFVDSGRDWSPWECKP